MEQPFRNDQVDHLAGEWRKRKHLPDCIEEHWKEQAFSKVEEVLLLDRWTGNETPTEESLLLGIEGVLEKMKWGGWGFERGFVCCHRKR